MPRSVTVTFDYRCPFARNGHEAVVNAVREGVDLDVRYAAFSLDQIHVEEGEPAIWERPPGEWGTGTLALLYGTTVRDHFPEHFLDAHLALFAARHDHGLKLGQESVVRDAVASSGVDVDAVAELAHAPAALAALRAEHDEMVGEHAVFGVPTFIAGSEAVFIRFMERGRVDDLERALDLLDWSRLNEFKRTKLPR